MRCGSWAAALSLLEEVAGGGRRGQRRRLQRGDRGLLARKAGRLGGRGGYPFSPTRPLRQVLHVGNQGLQWEAALQLFDITPLPQIPDPFVIPCT